MTRTVSTSSAMVGLHGSGPLQPLRALAATAVFWLLAGAVLLYRLGAFPRTGDYLTLHFNHDVFFEKPPLYFWASGLVIGALGFSEFTSRLPGVIFGALTLWVTTRWGRDLGGIVCGVVSGSLLLSTAMFLENGSRHATHDSLLLFLTMAVLWIQFNGGTAGPRSLPTG